MAKSKKEKRLDARKKKQKQKQMLKIRNAALVGIGVLAIAYFAFAASKNSGIQNTNNLSAEEVAALPSAPQVGARAPEFTLTSITGESVSLADYRGKPVAMMFFHTW